MLECGKVTTSTCSTCITPAITAWACPKSTCPTPGGHTNSENPCRALRRAAR